MTPKIAYYITAHGYGHGARSCDIINALHEAAPEVRIIVKTDLPEAFMRSRIPSAIDLRPGAFDVGLIQRDSIRVDLDASLSALCALCRDEERLIRQEAEFLRGEGIGAVVADIPAIPLAAAQQAGIQNIATSNFGWDWIYSEFIPRDSRWRDIAERFRRVYASTDLLMRQPFAEPMESFPNRVDLPLLARPGLDRRAELSRSSGADPAKRWVLLSFTSLNLESSALRQLASIPEHEFFTVEPLEWPGSSVRCIARADARFADIIASVDVVVTKPGFGIVSECIANNRPIIYSDREDFREYGVLVGCIRRYCRQAFIPNRDLYAGNLGPALKAIEAAAAPAERMADGGGAAAARIILGRLGSTS